MEELCRPQFAFELLNFGPRLKPLLDDQPLGIGNACGVIHRHDFADHGLLVDVLGVQLEALGRIKPHVLHLHLRAMAHGAALLQHLLHFYIAKLAISPCIACMGSS